MSMIFLCCFWYTSILKEDFSGNNKQTCMHTMEVIKHMIDVTNEYDQLGLTAMPLIETRYSQGTVWNRNGW